MNGYPSFYPRTALVAPSPGGYNFHPAVGCFSPGYRFFLTTGSCVSEPPTRRFFCVRTRDTLNLFLEWGNPLKTWPHFKQKIGHRLPYINYLYKGLQHTDIKIYINKLWSYQTQIMVKSFVSYILIWPHTARFKICLVTWPHCHVVVTWHCHCGCLDINWLSRDEQFKCTFKTK